MRDTSLLQLALGLVPPWTVIRSEFDPEARLALDTLVQLTVGEIPQQEPYQHRLANHHRQCPHQAETPIPGNMSDSEH
jgi:hypothetical protein